MAPKHAISPTAACELEAGNKNAGQLLYRLKHYMKMARVKRHGVLWVAHTRAYWCADVPLSLDQYNRAVKHLIGRGRVESRIMRFAGQPMTHLRLLETPQSSVAPLLHSLVGLVPHSPVGLVPHSSTGVHTGVPTGDYTYGIAASAGVPSGNKTEQEASKMDAATKLAIGGGAKAKDIVALVKGSLRASAKAMAQQPKVTTGQLELLWKQQCAKAYPDRVSVWNGKKGVFLRQLYDKLGAETPLIVVEAIKHWGSFTGLAKVQSGIKHAPTFPEPWYLLQQAEPLLAWWKKQKNPVAEMGNMKSVAAFFAEKGQALVGATPPVQSVAQPPDKCPGGVQTAEELEALFKEVTGG
jgi:hypothetical protein